MSKASKALVIYHANCDDGFGAALAFHIYREKMYSEVEYYPGIYNQQLKPDKPIDKNTDVFILDFSYDPETLCSIAGYANEVVLLDHHKTARDAWLKHCEQYYVALSHDCPYNLHVTFDLNRSGAMMAYHYFKPASDTSTAYDTFFEFLQDRDLWLFRNPHTQYFTQYLKVVPQNFECWKEIAEDLNNAAAYTRMVDKGFWLKQQFTRLCEQIIEQGKREVWINGIKGLECNCPSIFASDIGNMLAKESGTFGHTWILAADQSVHSLRSIGEFDVSELAKLFEGGGHKNAAGFTIHFKEKDELRRYADLVHQVPV